MRVTCAQCRVELHLDESKMPERRFSVRCPRCQKPIVIVPPGQEAPATEPVVETSASVAELTSLLRELLNSAPAGARANDSRNRRRVLLCFANPDLRNEITSSFNDLTYEVIAVEKTDSAINAMQDAKVDVLILDPNFDQEERGYETMMRYVSDLHPKERRRFYVVVVSPHYKTLDGRAAFIAGANLVVNSADASTLQSILERSIRDFNELYKLFHRAAGIEPF